MRWKPLGSRALPRLVEYPLLAIALVVFLPLLLVIWAERKKRKFFGPYADWQYWFAWHPVRSDRGFGSSVWLEWVERRLWYGSVEHRTLEEAARESVHMGDGLNDAF